MLFVGDGAVAVDEIPWAADVGDADGDLVGETVGDFDGGGVGETVGDFDGEAVGDVDGDFVGEAVGEVVGARGSTVGAGVVCAVAPVASTTMASSGEAILSIIFANIFIDCLRERDSWGERR